jgi:hypothetical protein
VQGLGFKGLGFGVEGLVLWVQGLRLLVGYPYDSVRTLYT